ncbi:hypothetical protein V1504DRAFT_436466 [Lipomyces starkeyi]
MANTTRILNGTNTNGENCIRLQFCLVSAPPENPPPVVQLLLGIEAKLMRGEVVRQARANLISLPVVGLPLFVHFSACLSFSCFSPGPFICRYRASTSSAIQEKFSTLYNTKISVDHPSQILKDMFGIATKSKAANTVFICAVLAGVVVMFILAVESQLDKYLPQSESLSADSVVEKCGNESARGNDLGIKISEPASSSKSPIVSQTPVPEESFDVKYLIPVTSSHFNFCRSLYTALINDYPKPTLINWGNVYTDSRHAHVGKISGVNEYLQQLGGQYVLIMDGFDVWYQLPFRSLVLHFLGITEPDNHELVVFGADKKCWPNKEDSPACVNIPESTLPIDAYGPSTDGREPVPNSDERFNFNRPRWLNSGNMIGPVSVLRDVYDRANHSISIAPPGSVKSDQMYIAEVFGQQDLNMTLDYKSELFQTMTFSHADVKFLEDDIFTSPRKLISQRRKLAVNMVSGTVPSVLHFNGPKDAMDTWWPKMWWSLQRNDHAVVEKSKEVYQYGGAYTINGQFLSWHDLCGDADVHNPSTWKSKDG